MVGIYNMGGSVFVFFKILLINVLWFWFLAEER